MDWHKTSSHQIYEYMARSTRHTWIKYIFWNEINLQKELNFARHGKRINSIEEINGKADIFRWLILQKFGGIFVDADSICVEPFDEHLLNKVDAFAGWEQRIKKGWQQQVLWVYTISSNSKFCFRMDCEIGFTARNKTTSMVYSGPGLLTRICQMMFSKY